MATYPDAKDYDLYDANPDNPRGVLAFNKAHAAAFLAERDELMTKYKIERDSFDKAIQIPIEGMRALLHTTRKASLEMLLSYDTPATPGDYYIGDDGCDYNRAAMLQVTWCTEMLIDYDTDELLLKMKLLDTLNARREDIEDSDADCFILGFADHGSDISTLMLANHEEY